ncbi:hypothetical protein K7X08_010254 [Anisodus acutangulus]|uniref:Uncharacterized protein n=1 Tax=Anisodus acutangulus TaxID=402998 RepID=A0A9Q1RVK4_9SOLA|nr:hypothetical protein K7X08_010254 [Anisodus acutangulus]
MKNEIRNRKGRHEDRWGNNDYDKGKRKRKVKKHPTVKNRARTRSRKNVEVIPSVNTIESVENVVVDDEAEIEHENEKFGDRDESDNEREESDKGACHKNNGAKEGDQVDVDRGATFPCPSYKETYQAFMMDFVPLGQDFSDKRIDRMRKELKGATTITRAEAARGVGDVFGGGSGDGVGPYGSVDVDGVSAGGIGTLRYTVICSHCVHESLTLNKVLEDVANIQVAHVTILHRIEQLGKSNLKGGIHEQSLEGSAVKTVKTLDLYKPIDIEKKAYLSWINMRSDGQHIDYTVNMDFTWFKYLSRPENWLTDDVS